MAVRALLIFVCISLAIAGCKEPYETFPLGVTSVTNHVSGQTQTYRYHDSKLYTFFSKVSADTLANMMFHFTGDELAFITSDSIYSHRKRTLFYKQEDGSVIDSTFYYNPDTTMVTARRIVSYDADGNPVVVKLKTWIDTVATEEMAELIWEGGNVTHLKTSNITTGEVTNDVQIEYDGENCIYMKRPEYLFTFPLKDLYWLSKNNPLTFVDAAGERSYSYQYNKLGYPSGYQSYTGTTFGVSYTQIR